ncbi:MAG: tRNA uridine-5-carboxymethylaminomethyl(34) synthesis GTPase MnmE [Nitrospirae bacterium]|nr:tRNA uridine-5-carboxymethylaminomethyl(34) synthesis GTPase MnmE [Nitrospirota bacterium]MBI3378135.1 tRNA uridine-5-carboxymethylaminomethyl(34) synthesis GTPase MnmE [Nitrospirota bacterium]
MLDDTIAAISTPAGEGGIGIVRLSGKDAIKIAGRLFHSSKGKTLSASASHRIIYGFIKDPETNETVDEALVSIMRSPNTYTREDIVEINCHGGMSPLRDVLELAVKNGARLAEPGEFTKRAFLNGRLDLSEAEAVLDLIRAKTDESRRIALEQLRGKLSEKILNLREQITKICVFIEAYIDFPEEDIELASKKEIIESAETILKELESLLKSYDEGRFFREGLAAAIVGKPNVGKSSLLNALLQKDRAIVTDTPGTTRDTIEEYLNINGLPLRIIDTAGIRESHDMAEKEGVKRSIRAMEDADLVIAVIDGSEPLKDEDIEVLGKTKGKNTIIVINKSDLISSEEQKSRRAEVKRLLGKRSFPLVGNPSEERLRTSRSDKSDVYDIFTISATRGEGIEGLKQTIFNSSVKNWKEQKEGVIVTNLRHKIAIQAAYDSLKNGIKAIETDKPLEIIAIEFRDALDRLGEIVGAVTTDDILNRIFSDFCIGK